MAPNPISPTAPNLTNLSTVPFHLSTRRPQPTFSPPETLRRLRNSSTIRTTTSLTRPRFALLDEQQGQGLVSFTDEENSLVEALVGIQGRGRSASPQQLAVPSSQLLVTTFLFLNLISYHVRNCIAGCGASREDSRRFRRRGWSGLLSSPTPDWSYTYHYTINIVYTCNLVVMWRFICGCRQAQV